MDTDMLHLVVGKTRTKESLCILFSLRFELLGFLGHLTLRLAPCLQSVPTAWCLSSCFQGSFLLLLFSKAFGTGGKEGVN